MRLKEFGGGSVSVMTHEIRWGGRNPSVELNWSAIGAVSIDRAKAFRDVLNDAIRYAEDEAKRIGL